MKRTPWTREELDFLADHYGRPGWNSGRIQAEKPGPRRSISALRQKARYLGLADLDRRGNWKHDPAMHEDIYDLAVLDYTQDEIAEAISAQYGINVTGEWTARTMKKRLPRGVYAAWVKRANERRARGVAESWKRRKETA
jgi:hypothetical protein